MRKLLALYGRARKAVNAGVAGGLSALAFAVTSLSDDGVHITRDEWIGAAVLAVVTGAAAYHSVNDPAPPPAPIPPANQ